MTPKKTYFSINEIETFKHRTVAGKWKYEYISVDSLKEWIEQQAEKNHESIGALSILVKLETFLNSEE